MLMNNYQMAGALAELESLLERSDAVGFAAARNTKIFTEALSDYNRIREELIGKYGTHDKDDDGNELPTISIYPGYENFDQFMKEMNEIGIIEQDVPAVTLKYEKALGVLTGKQLLALDWMFSD